jgi:hypothetical protein
MTRACILGLLTLFGCCSGASGEPAIDAENLLLSPPKDFKVGYQSQHDNQSMTEMVPTGETVENWTQIFTVQIYRRSTVDSATFLQGLGKLHMNACPGTTAKGIFTGKTNGYDVSMLVLKCPKNPATERPETTAFRVIKGNDALYSVQHAWRADPSDAEIDRVMHLLAKVTVCDTRTPDHPCPSLDSLTSP